MTIIGAGYIGLEFAGIYGFFGSEVTALNTHSIILPREDNIDEIINILEKRNVKFINNVSLNEIKEENKIAKLIYTKDNKDYKLESDIILLTAGRKANIDNLKLENANLELNAREFIKVNEILKTSTENIWALGDVNGGTQFTSISLDDYRIVVNHLYGDKTRTTTDRQNVPNALFFRS